jgi:toxin-antitoxin system PIN domain toxin
MPRPLKPRQALEVVDEWLSHPAVEIVEPTERHWEVLKDLLMPLGTAGNITADAHLAALAIERGARLASADNDFARFARLRWSNPLT